MHNEEGKMRQAERGITNELLEHILQSIFQLVIAVMCSKVYFASNWKAIHVHLHKE